MTKLPVFQTALQELSLMQTKWASILNVLLGNPSLNSNLLTGVALINGTTVVNHLLGRKLIGWRVVGINAQATLYDTQVSNPTPQLTLVLVSTAAVTVNLEVF